MYQENSINWVVNAVPVLHSILTYNIICIWQLFGKFNSKFSSTCWIRLNSYKLADIRHALFHKYRIQQAISTADSHARLHIIELQWWLNFTKRRNDEIEIIHAVIHGIQNFFERAWRHHVQLGWCNLKDKSTSFFTPNFPILTVSTQSLTRDIGRPCNNNNNNNKMHRYRRETALQGALVLAKSGRLEQGDNILRTL